MRRCAAGSESSGLAIDERVDAVLVAGDVFEGANRTLRAQVAFRDGLEPAGPGAHPVVRRDRQPRPAVGLGAGRDLARAGLAVRGRGGHEPADRARRDRAGPGPRDQLRGPRRHPQPRGHVPARRRRAVRDRPAPRQRRRDRGLRATTPRARSPTWRPAAWTTGRSAISTSTGSCGPRIRRVVYCGNPQGRDPGETDPRGCYLVDVDERGRVEAGVPGDGRRPLAAPERCRSTASRPTRPWSRRSAMRSRPRPTAAGRSIVALVTPRPAGARSTLRFAGRPSCATSMTLVRERLRDRRPVRLARDDPGRRRGRRSTWPPGARPATCSARRCASSSAAGAPCARASRRTCTTCSSISTTTPRVRRAAAPAPSRDTAELQATARFGRGPGLIDQLDDAG